jgi:hypothetical protein
VVSGKNSPLLVGGRFPDRQNFNLSGAATISIHMSVKSFTDNELTMEKTSGISGTAFAYVI